MIYNQSKKALKEQRMKALPQGFGIEWTSSLTFRIESTQFRLAAAMGDHDVVRADGTNDSVFYLCKDTGLIRRYLNLLKERMPENVVELGVLRGGSVAFLQLLAKPRKFLALELAPERVPILEHFIESKGLEDSLRVEYGVDQADASRIKELVSEHFGGERNIDLVIDDASHLLAPTRTSFETLFPLIRPGGSYIVEDFSAAHILFSADLEAIEKSEGNSPDTIRRLVRHSLQEDNRPVHLLAVEAMLAAIIAPEIIQRVVVDRQWLKIVRGARAIDQNKPFDLRTLAADRFGLTNSEPHDSIKKYLN